MFVREAVVVLCCLALPPPAVARAVPPPVPAPLANPAPWDPSPAPVLLQGDLFPVADDRRIGRPVTLADHSGFDVAAGRTLRVDGAIATDPGLYGGTQLWKLGAGHMALAGDNAYLGNTMLLQGSLALQSGGALGQPGNTLDQFAGTRLELADGVVIGQTLHVQAPGAWAPVPADWTVPTVPPIESVGADAAGVRVAAGLATWQGLVMADAPIVKDGAGTLRLAGMGLDFSGQPLRLRQGGLRIDGIWVGAVHSDPGTVLAGTGWVDQARVGGWLRPGAPDAVGTLSIGSQLWLEPGAATRIRIDAAGAADQLWSQGGAHLDGTLWVDAIQGDWTPQTRWTIVQADTGLDSGRFTQIHGTLRYLDPFVTYEPTRAVLGLRYNARGLDTADPGWRTALLDDSRFLRDAALAHAGSGRAWVQTWAANTTRPAAQGAPGDDRDTHGMQLGASRALAPGWHAAAFAGYQGTTWHDELDSSPGTRLGGAPAGSLGGATGSAAAATPASHGRDRAYHIGLGASHRRAGWRFDAGIAHAWHRADLRRQADAQEAPLRSRARAGLTQLWLAAAPVEPYTLGAWELAPHLQAAWLRLHRGAVREDGGLAAVNLPAQTDTRWLTQPGVRLQRRWPTAQGDATLAVDLGLRSLWGGTTLPSLQAYQADPARTLHASGLPLARHALRLDVGVQAPISRRARLGLAYTGQHGSGQHQHGAWLQLSVALEGHPI